MKVRLLPWEIEWVALIGIKRRVMDRAANFAEKYGTPNNPWDADIEAVLAEYAVAKVAGVHWSGNLGCLRASDAGPLQVRATRHLNGGLILHPDDKDRDYFVCAVGGDGDYDLCGYLLAQQGKVRDHWRDENTKPKFQRPAYCVPAELLKPIEKLLPYVRARAG